jgi:putative nucleotidyltransferase with HDIG domain
MPGNLGSIIRIVLFYIIFATLWILLTDQFPFLVDTQIVLPEQFQTIKGLLFVFTTAVLLFVLLFGELKEREEHWRAHLQEKENLLVQVRDINKELISAYNRTIEGWARVLEMRNREVKDHSRRVTDLSIRLARFMGIPESELSHLRRGALLHDIGKMAIPDAIILKSGDLSHEERAEIRRHPLYGYEMLSEIEFLTPALDILLCHHEKWDGQGYPFGLSGEQIPIFARIFAVVDVWDALLSERTYHDPMTEDEALSFILNESGAHFDPAVVEAFIVMLEQEEGIKPPHIVRSLDRPVEP